MASNVETVVQRTMELGQSFAQISDKLITRVCGFNLTQVKICLFMSKNGGTILQKDIETFLPLSRPAISQIADQMINAGLVMRSGVETDRRLKRISLTDLGKSIAKRSSAELQEIYKAVGAVLSAQDVAQLTAILEKMETALENSSDKNSF